MGIKDRLLEINNTHPYGINDEQLGDVCYEIAIIMSNANFGVNELGWTMVMDVQKIFGSKVAAIVLFNLFHMND